MIDYYITVHGKCPKKFIKPKIIYNIMPCIKDLKVNLSASLGHIQYCGNMQFDATII